ncbi:MAG: glycosyltransferase family 2 protein [Armatimonadetes bacterium]|nr:glycosyltransferase family 2 protein [Armatimonadota bacterium]
MPTLSAVLIVRNEEAVLPRCLASLAGWVDEIVVVDDHSTDASAELARAAGAKVVQRRLDRFDVQRNFGVAQSTGEWILSIDADEVVTPALAREIREVIAAADAADIYGVPFLHRMFGRWPRHGGWQEPLRRLYRREVRWAGAVHERVAQGWREGVLTSPILHWSHQDIGEFLAKLNRYTDDEARARAAEGARYSGAKLLLSPLRDFWRRYVRLGGYRDGAVGLVLAGLMACYVFVVRAKTWEQLNPADDPAPTDWESPA